MEFDIFLGVAALVIAAVLTWCILRFFFAPRRGGARATLHDGVQQATITVRGGYSPDIVTMQAGIPITLRFDRKETGECTSHVVFPDLGTDTMLPGNETTEMSLPPLPAGDYPFACGMNMVHGLLRVEGETDSAIKPDDGTASTGTAIPAGTPRMSAADALLAEGAWQALFSHRPEPLTATERADWLAAAADVSLGSDAFFPFGDNIERAHRSGVTYVAQPGGSIRDDNVIDACNLYNMVMCFTHMRLFHH